MLLIEVYLGGLLILALFACGWDTFKCSERFEELANRLFRARHLPNGRGLVQKLQKYVQMCLTTKYDKATSDPIYQEAFGSVQSLFGANTQRISGTKVAVAATSAADASCCLFTNYNPVARRPEGIGTLYIIAHTCFDAQTT